MEKPAFGQGEIEDLLTSPKTIFETPNFRGVRKIDKEELPKNIQDLCGVLGAKLMQVSTGNNILLDITVGSKDYIDIVHDAGHYEDFDMQTLHLFFQRKLLQTMYPGKAIAYIGAFEDDDKVQNIQEAFGNKKKELKFFPAHDGRFGTSIWTVR